MSHDMKRLQALKERFDAGQSRLLEMQELERRESLAFLIESDLNQAEVILAAKNINSELQDTAEKLANIQVKEIMPLEDQVKDIFGPDQAQAFTATMTAAFTEVNQALRSAKDQVGNAILRLEGKDVQSNDMMTDPAVANAATDTSVSAMNEPADTAPTDPFAGADAAAGPATEPLGRARRESVDYRAIGSSLLLKESFGSLMGWLLESPEVAAMDTERRGDFVQKISQRANSDKNGVAGWIGVRKYGPAVAAQLNPKMIAPLPEDMLSPAEKAKLGNVVGSMTQQMSKDPNFTNKTVSSASGDINPNDRMVVNKVTSASGKGSSTKVGDFLKAASDEMEEGVAVGAEHVKGSAEQTDAGKYPANKNRPTQTATATPKPLKPTSKASGVLARGTVSEVAVGAEHVTGTAHQTDAGKNPANKNKPTQTANATPKPLSPTMKGKSVLANGTVNAAGKPTETNTVREAKAVGAEHVKGSAEQTDAGKYPANKNKPTQTATATPKPLAPTAKAKGVLAKGTVSEETVMEKRRWADDEDNEDDTNDKKRGHRDERKARQKERDSFDKVDENLNERRRWDDEEEDDDYKSGKKKAGHRDAKQARKAEKDDFDKMDEEYTIEAYGVRGAHNMPWRKVFVNADALTEWVALRSARVMGKRYIGEKIENVVDVNLPTNTYGQLKSDPHETDYGRYSDVDNGSSKPGQKDVDHDEGNANKPTVPTTENGQIKGTPHETDAGKFPANKNQPTQTSKAKPADANLKGGSSKSSSSDSGSSTPKSEPKPKAEPKTEEKSGFKPFQKKEKTEDSKEDSKDDDKE